MRPGDLRYYQKPHHMGRPILLFRFSFLPQRDPAHALRNASPVISHAEAKSVFRFLRLKPNPASFRVVPDAVPQKVFSARIKSAVSPVICRVSSSGATSASNSQFSPISPLFSIPAAVLRKSSAGQYLSFRSGFM